MKLFDFFNKKKRSSGHEIAPDEIFLDSQNLPNFDVHQFEGRIEKPISKNIIIYLGIFFLLTGIIFASRIGVLQIEKGKAFKLQSENNRLHHTPLFSERGIIYDKNEIELAWNSPGEDVFPNRSYVDEPGLSNLLGYIGYPARDKKGVYYQTEFTGKDGLEYYYNKELNGDNGLKITETDALMNIRSESVVKPPVDGKSLNLTIDSAVQSNFMSLWRALRKKKVFPAVLVLLWM